MAAAWNDDTTVLYFSLSLLRLVTSCMLRPLEAVMFIIRDLGGVTFVSLCLHFFMVDYCHQAGLLITGGMSNVFQLSLVNHCK